MKINSGQFVTSMLIVAVLLLNHGFVVCNCQAGHTKVEPVIHSSCHHNHAHSHCGIKSSSHDHIAAGSPIFTDFFAGQSGNCDCVNCVDVPLESSELLPVNTLDISTYFAELEESVFINEAEEILLPNNSNSFFVSSFHFPLNTIIMRN